MTTVLNAFENGLADETTLTAPTSGYAGADDLSDVHAEGTGASAKVDTQIKYTDTRSLKLTVPKTTAGDRRRVWVDHAPLFSATLIADCLFYVPRVDPQPQQIIMQGIDPDGFDRWGVLLDNDGRLRMRTFTNGNASGGRTSSSIQYDTWFRVAVFSSIHATTQASNILTLRYYADPAGAVSQEIANNGANLGAQGETFAMARAGRINPSAAAAMTMYIDYFRADSVGWLGAPVIPTTGMQWVEQEPYGAGGFNGIFQSLIDPLTFFSISDVGGMRVSRDGGETWHLSTKGAYLAENHKKTAGYGISLNPEDLSKEIIAIGCGFNGADPAIIASYDSGHTWVHKSNQVGFNSQSPNDTHSPPLPKNPRSIQKLIDIDPIAGPNGKGYWYAASFAKGIYRSVDGGTNWTLISMPQVGSITDAWYPRYLTLYPGDGNKLIVGVYDAYGHQGLWRLDGVRSGTNISPVRLSPVAGEIGGGGGGGSTDFNLKQLPEITPGVQDTTGAANATPSFPKRHGSNWYIVGPFDQAIDIDGTVYNRNSVMRFSATAPYAMDTSWNPAPDNECYDTALSPDGTKLIVVGNFTTFGGNVRNKIAEVDLTTMSVTSKFSTLACNGAIRCCQFDTDGNLWVGGGFTSIGGVTRTRLAKLDSTGAVMSVNVACVANWVQDLDLAPDATFPRILVYLRNDGTVGGGATCKLAALAYDGTVAWRANPNVGTFTFQIAYDKTTQTIAAATNGDNRTFNHVKLSGATNFWWHSDGNNQGVTCFRGHMIVGHHGAFTELNPNIGSGDAGTDATSGGLYSIDIADAIDGSGGLDAWRPSFNSTLRAHRIGSDEVSGQVCVTGDFTTVSQGGTTVNRARVALFETQSGGGGGVTLPLVNSVEEAVFDDDGVMYMACATDGIWKATAPYTPDKWVDLDPTQAFISKSSHWNAVAVSDKGAHTTISVGCHNPVRVSATGVPGGSLNKYGCAYMITNAESGSPTITYVTDPGTSGFPGGGDADVNVNDISTGKRFWRADDGADNILGRSASSVAAIVNDYSDKNRWINQGGAGICWVSTNDGLTYQAAATGMVIGSTMSVTADPLRAGWFLSGNQDHDAFYTDNGGNDWQRTPNVADFTIGFNGYCHSNGYWYLCEGDDVSQTGRILRWDGTGTTPSWTTIAGAAAGGKTGTTNGVPTNRGLAAVAGLAADGITLREVIWMENDGIWYRDGGTGTWTQATGFPRQVEDTDTRSAGHSLIWPSGGSSGYLWAVVRSGSSPGLWRSVNRGSTWSNEYPMSAMGRCEGYVVGNNLNNHTLFLTGSGGSLIRVENAAGTETFRTITSFVGPRALALEPAGRLLVWTMPTATALAHLWAVDSPNGTGTTMSAVDLFDPATEASDEQGQHVGWNVKSLASNGQQIMMAVNGASVARGILT